jgi:protein Mpv17
LTNINITPILQFTAYAVLNTPINIAWQNWLESAFPSTKPAVVEKAVISKADGKTSNVKSVDKQQVLDVKNTALKFLLDQTAGAAFNIPLFIGIIGMLKGQNGDQILAAVRRVR